MTVAAIIIIGTAYVTFMWFIIAGIRDVTKRPTPKRLPHDTKPANLDEARMIAEAFMKHYPYGGGWWH